MGLMVPHCSHITRKRGTYTYRRRLPRPLRGEVALSLGTDKFRVAEALTASLDVAFDAFFENHGMADFDVQATLRTYLRAKLARMREKHLTTPRGQPVHSAELYGYSTPAEADLAGLNHQIRQMKADIRRRDVRAIDQIADGLTGGTEVTKAQWMELALGVLQAEIQLLEQCKTWITDGLAEPIDLSVPDSAATHPRAQPSVPALQDAPSAAPPADGPLLSEVLPGFMGFVIEEDGWRGQTVAQANASYRMFMEVCGDRPVKTYERRDLAAFFDVLRALPALYSKDKRWRHLTLQEAVKASQSVDVARLTMKTVARHFSALGRLFDYLKRRGQYTGENPAQGFEYGKKGRAKRKRDMWEKEPLEKLFASPVWNGCLSATRRTTAGHMVIKDDKYWLPLLGVYHGNRLEEFAQLHRSDVRCEGGIWWFDINDEGAKQLKNEQSARRVPIHPVLIRLGFLDYLDAATSKPDDLVFPELRPGGPDNKRGYGFSKWFTRYRQQVGVYDKRLNYHSFRHGVTTKLAAAGVPIEVRNELLGHEGESTDEKVYLKKLPLELLADAISKVHWPELAPITGESGE